MFPHPATQLLQVERDGNPLRRYGHASPFIGKLGPLDCARLDQIGQLTRAALPDLPEPTLVIGMTESSLLLAFWMALWQQKPVDLRFTSRKIRAGEARKIAFQEPHSHGPQHYLALENGARYAQIVIIEDELTTGATLRNLILALEGVSNRVWVATLRDLRTPDLRRDLESEMRARGVVLQVIALDEMSSNLPVELTPIRPHFNPFGRAHNDRVSALCQLRAQWQTFAPDQIYMIGECVDITLGWWLQLPVETRPDLRQITRSPWKTDGEAIRSAQIFAAPNQGSRYFLYNFAPPKNRRVLWIAEKCNASVGAPVSEFFAANGIEARGIEVAGNMTNFQTPWPNLRLYARDCGLVNPYDAANAASFRGEEAFASDVAGWKRWSKPSPEPQLDADFEPILLASIAHQAPQIHAMARALAAKIVAANPDKPPVLIAILRAGAPICALLAPLLSEHYRQQIPVCAFSMFYGLGWDEAALKQILADYPNHTPIFVDGWTSGGGVATQIKWSFADWKARGNSDFSDGRGPQFAVLCDPRGVATHSAIRADFWVPSAAFTAPETLGFSRGFAFEDGGLFGVYRFPPSQLKPHWVAAWRAVANAESAPLPPDDAATAMAPPAGFRVHVNEVTRALINRNPLAIWLLHDESQARQTLAPLLYLAKQRGVPIEFGRADLAGWGALAIARMK